MIDYTREQIEKLQTTEASVTSAPEQPEPRRFYVSMTWDDWPEGGSYGTTVLALDHEAAEEACKLEMAELRADEDTDSDKWHVVDCFDLDEFITNNMQP